MRLIAGLLALVGCSQGSPGAGKSATPAAHDSADTGLEDSAEQADLALFDAALAGEVPAEEALATIADRSGWPLWIEGDTYRVACLCGPGDWAVVGDHSDWQDTPLQRTGDLVWADIEVPDADGSLYKFRQDGRDIADVLARRYRYDDFGEASYVRASAAHLERWWIDGAHGLPARRLRVWVPASGQFSHALYAHDGQNLFDPGAGFGGWRLQDSIAAAPLLVVGIDNAGEGRMFEYTPTVDIIGGTEVGGGALAYAELVADIRRKMESAYGPADTTGLLGSSLGGLVSLVLADHDPTAWDAALSLSGTIGWGSIGAAGPTFIDTAADYDGPQGPALYLDSGGGGECQDTDLDGILDDGNDSDNYCVNRQLADVLADHGYTWDTDLWHWHEPGAPHNEAAWADRVDRPLNLFMGL